MARETLTAVLIFIVLFFCACTSPQVQAEAATVKRQPLAWDGKHKDAAKWTEHIIEVLDAAALTDITPKDVSEFCPGFNKFDQAGRTHFWAQLISMMAKRESGFKPETKYKEDFKDAHGNWVISRGLLQISQESANSYGCGISKAEMLHDANTNLECGVRIITRWVFRDLRIAGKIDGKWQGAARYWSVMRSVSKSYRVIKEYMRGLEICKP